MEGQPSGAITIIAAAVIGGFSGYMGAIFESVGDYAATCAACDEVYRVKHIDKGIMASGLGCMITALFGGLPCTSYTQNIGIVAATGVASRRVTQFAGGGSSYFMVFVLKWHISWQVFLNRLSELFF